MLETSKLARAKWTRKVDKWVKRISLGATVVGTLFGAYFEWDSVTKRETFPERNVLFRVRQKTTFSGGNTEHEDRKSVV